MQCMTLCFRNNNSISVIQISDIFEAGDMSVTETWGFNMLRKNIQEEKLSIIKFDFRHWQVSY